MSQEKAIIFFARPPLLGKVKTRLAKKTNPQFALNFYIFCLNHINSLISSLANHHVYIFTSENNDVLNLPLREIYKRPIFKQEGSDLGQRMSNAIDSLISKNYKSVIICATDTPDLSLELIQQAKSYLQSNDVVFGPSLDGGYYLVAINKNHYHLFLNKTWGHCNVLTDAINSCLENNLKVKLLKVLRDIDTFSDFKEWVKTNPRPLPQNLDLNDLF